MSLDTRFAVDFGNLLEGYLEQQGNLNLITDVCFLLEIDKAELSQIFNGYDTPSTAIIFELLKTIGDKELMWEFLQLPTVFGSTFIPEGKQPKVIETLAVPIINNHRPINDFASELDFEDDD